MTAIDSEITSTKIVIKPPALSELEEQPEAITDIRKKEENSFNLPTLNKQHISAGDLLAIGQSASATPKRRNESKESKTQN